MSKFKKQVFKDIERLENAIRQDREREFQRVYGYPFSEWGWSHICPDIPCRHLAKKPHYFTNQRVIRIIGKHDIKDFDDIAFLINLANRVDGNE